MVSRVLIVGGGRLGAAIAAVLGCTPTALPMADWVHPWSAIDQAWIESMFIANFRRVITAPADKAPSSTHRPMGTWAHGKGPCQLIPLCDDRVCEYDDNF